MGKERRRRKEGRLRGGLGILLAAAMLKTPFKNVKKRFDADEVGGAPFIGVEKLVIKSHGSSKAQSICGSIMQVYNMHKNNLIGKIKDSLPEIQSAE